MPIYHDGCTADFSPLPFPALALVPLPNMCILAPGLVYLIGARGRKLMKTRALMEKLLKDVGPHGQASQVWPKLTWQDTDEPDTAMCCN
jgi:hypothetical protein